MTIDRNTLDEAIRQVRVMFTSKIEAVEQVCEAASAWAATLPREVEVERWGIVDVRGDCFRVVNDEESAREWARVDADWQVIRLTGTAVLPRVKD